MAKGNNVAKSEGIKPGTFDGPEWEKLRARLDAPLPDDFKKRSMDPVGFWIPKIPNGKNGFLPIRCIIQSAKLLDAKLDKSKPSVLLIAELTAPAPLSVKEENIDDDMEIIDAEKGDILIGKKGDIVGIWGKPGMRDVIPLGGVEVSIQMNPESKWKKIKDRPSKMVTFDIRSAKVGTKIPIISDQRKESKDVRPWIQESTTSMPTGSDDTDFDPSKFDPIDDGADPAADRL